MVATLGLVATLLLIPWAVHAQSDATAPTNLTAAIVDGGVALNWDAPAEDAGSVTGYEILRRRPRQGERTLLIHVADTRSATTTYTDIAATEPGERYVYRVKARRGGEQSARSNFVRVDIPESEPPPTPQPTLEPEGVLPAAPTGLSANPSYDRVTLSWDNPEDDGVTGYRILRGADADTLAVIAEDTGNAAREHVDEDVEPEPAYSYAVQAINTDGAGPQSGAAGVTTLAAPSLVVVNNEDDESPAARSARSSHDEPCTGGGFDPTPTAVAVTAVPIVVASTTADYFVLYVKHDLDGTEVEVPVLVKRGEAGTTTLAENVEALPAERYRVEKYLVANPADVDGDCIDDITELADLVGMNPVNSAPAIDINDGVVAVPDIETLKSLAGVYQEQWYFKFILFNLDTDAPAAYFIRLSTHPGHSSFLHTVGLDQNAAVVGSIIFDPQYTAPDGSQGLHYYLMETGTPIFEREALAYTALAASLPLLDDDLALYIPTRWLHYYQSELELYQASRIDLVFDGDVLDDISFLTLNRGNGYGLLRVVSRDERPNPRDVVIYESLPNDLPRVAGIITTVPQTPLSHVNLRAVQDGVPNAFIRGALDDGDIDDLIGSYVRYTVTGDGYSIRAATRAEVDAHYASTRPTTAQTPVRDLSETEITPLSEIEFEDWTAFGVKAANVAVLGTLGFPPGTIPDGGTVPIGGTVPDGFAVPFYFYDAFMKANDLDTYVEEMLADEDFQTDYDDQEDDLKTLRKKIKKGTTPDWIITALEAMHAKFPEGTSLRYRSSTNNEDLPGFSGAGLYDSKTQDPDETEDDGIDKSIKGVWESLWNFRAFTERDFHRVDHMATAMGVLVHPNYSDERSNGVAVSFDPIYLRDGDYYVNTQLGEDLVTNPEALSTPEEILLDENGEYIVLATSNQVPPGQLLMSDAQLLQLRGHLAVIHDHFAQLYNPAPGERFAMEIEFKITVDDILAIKQARPWVFSDALITQPLTVSNTAPTFPATETGARTVPENTAAGRNIGAPVVATDADGDTLTYNLSGTDADAFDLVATSGQLRTKAALDRQTKASYTVTVSVHDGKDASGNTGTMVDDTVTVTISVVQAVSPPQRRRSSGGGGGGGGRSSSSGSVVFTDGTIVARSVAENTIPDPNDADADKVGEPVVATDANNNPLTYSLGGANAALFTIDADSGQLRVGAGTALDYETTSSYAVTVVATGSSGGRASITVIILVTDVGLGVYDADNNEVIDRDEVLAAIADYLQGVLSKEEMLAVIERYFAS